MKLIAVLLFAVGVAILCGGAFMLLVVVVAWFVPSQEKPYAPTVVVAVLEESSDEEAGASVDEEDVLFSDQDTGHSHVAVYKTHDERIVVPNVLRIRPRPVVIPRAERPPEVVHDPEDDEPIATSEEEA